MQKIVLVLPALASLSSIAAPSCDAEIFDLPGVIAFAGCISEDSAQSLIRLLDKHPDVPLVVKSTGGAVNAAIDVARTMLRHRTRLIIRGECLSSCANYWLPVARFVEVEEGGVILFHGDARTTLDHLVDPRTIDEETRRGMAEVVVQERSLGRDVPRVEEIHALQAIRVSAQPVEIRLGGNPLSCPGLNQRPHWAPTLERLQAMGYVDRVVPRHSTLAPSISSEPTVDPGFLTADDSDPLARCTAVVKP